MNTQPLNRTQVRQFHEDGYVVCPISLCNHPGDDIHGMIARCRRVVDAMEQLLGVEVYHYHSKMMLKEPEVGGACIDHGPYGEQTGADQERVQQALRRFELIYFEANPGDALFFHSNGLHCSAPNLSSYPRWTLICCCKRR